MIKQRLAGSIADKVVRTAEKLFRLEELDGERSEVVAKKLVHRVVPVAGVISFVPGSALFLSSLELALMLEIAKIYNLDPTQLNAQMIVAQLGLRFGVSQGAAYVAEGLDVLPIVGNIAKGVVGGSVVYVIGIALVRYFESRYPGRTFQKT